MSVIKFESVVEDNLIRIPEEYIGQIPDMVSVTLVDAERFNSKSKILNSRQIQRAAFEEFFTAMAEINDEPIDNEFDEILLNRLISQGQ